MKTEEEKRHYYEQVVAIENRAYSRLSELLTGPDREWVRGNERLRRLPEAQWLEMACLYKTLGLIGTYHGVSDQGNGYRRDFLEWCDRVTERENK